MLKDFYTIFSFIVFFIFLIFPFTSTNNFHFASYWFIMYICVYYVHIYKYFYIYFCFLYNIFFNFTFENGLCICVFVYWKLSCWAKVIWHSSIAMHLVHLRIQELYVCMYHIHTYTRILVYLSNAYLLIKMNKEEKCQN